MSETLIDSRCTLCGWADVTDDSQCPQCGHGLVDYEVIYE
jgi:rubredoxin